MQKIAGIFSFVLFGFALNMVGQNTLDASNNTPTFEQLKAWRLAALTNSDYDQKIEANNKFKAGIKTVLNKQLKLSKPLDSIPKFGVVKSPDKKLTFYNWNIITNPGEFEYFAFMVIKGKEVIELTDKSNTMANAETSKLPPNKWYGALYYSIIPTKVKKQGSYYVLLGWDGYSNFSTRKVIDVLYYDKQLGNWVFGKPIFGPPFSGQYRYFIEYSSKVVVSLKYHPKEKNIVFDHVVPPNKGLEGIYEFYVPDMSFDAFQLDKTRWNFVQNIDVRGDQTMENYTDPNPGNRPR